jgi:CDP-diacylglycerol--glycerol-3-phosphate 3-phosphatidyltransferase
VSAEPTTPQVRSLNVPNALTVFRIILVPVFLYLLLVSDTQGTALRYWALGVYIVAAITDLIDGDYARRTGQVTPFGQVADPIADKALIGAALIGLSWLGDLPWWVTAVILARELAVTVLRWWARSGGVIPASRGGKLKTVLQLFAVGFYLLPVDGSVLDAIRVVLMAAAVVVTLVTAVDYLFRAVRLRRVKADLPPTDAPA